MHVTSFAFTSEENKYILELLADGVHLPLSPLVDSQALVVVVTSHIDGLDEMRR